MGRSRNGGDYSPFEDDYRGFEIRDDETARGPLILALAIGVLLVFGAVVWNTYRQGVRANGAGIPSVIADSQPYKRTPEDRGGIAVPDTDKRFYDQMDASDRPAAQDAELADEERSTEFLQGGPPIELRPGIESAGADETDPENGMPNAVADQVKALADLDSRPAESDEDLEVAAVNPVPMPMAAQPMPRQQAMSEFEFAANGAFMVQVAAFRSEEAAETAWRKASSSRPDIYQGASKHIQRADLGAKGVFYRLRVGTFAERSEASAFCDALKASGENCIVVTG
ncbi:SPOR domain-containing protein [Hyphomonas oceanitis]|uniref:Sporulation repeat-containing protein n=1 Tax=Hyphomonas oceanitis SCH89 TaxID=1280953 RepID=A0A059G255_9PROT|nr:SPOR domain-containing protein [Hyphomonas oceanitis]KDA00819.1 sporulation repeat-containing protein [Hyphomonas oceanitis SCH89]